LSRRWPRQKFLPWPQLATDVRGLRRWLYPGRGGQHVHGVHDAPQLRHPRCRLLWFVISTDVHDLPDWLCPGRGGQHVHCVHDAPQLRHPRCRLLWFVISTDVHDLPDWLWPGRDGQHVHGVHGAISAPWQNSYKHRRDANSDSDYSNDPRQLRLERGDSVPGRCHPRIFLHLQHVSSVGRPLLGRSVLVLVLHCKRFTMHTCDLK